MPSDPASGADTVVDGLRSQSVDHDVVRRLIRRRIALFGAGVAIAIVGFNIDPVVLGFPLFVPTVAGIVGVAIALLGLLGIRIGLGCLTQVLGVTLLSFLACGVDIDPASLRVTVVLAVLAGAGALIVRRREPKVGPLFDVLQTLQRGPGSAAKVIDVDARDTSPSRPATTDSAPEATSGPAMHRPALDVQARPKD